MAIDKTNPITSHELVLFMPTAEQPEGFGWIRLLNGEDDAGYIWLVSPPETPHLSMAGTYIVTSAPISQMATMLDILRNEKDLLIDFHDSQDGSTPAVAIGSATKGNAAASPFSVGLETVPAKLAATVARLGR